MNKKEAFKEFLKKNKNFSKLVNEGKTTYQKLFETFDIYGEDKSVWNNILNETVSNKSKTGTVKEVLNNLKNIDLDKLEENVTSLEKALTFLEDIIASRSEKTKEKKERQIKPSEIERFFDD